MALDSSATFEAKHPTVKTREMRAIDVVRAAINHGKALNLEELNDILSIITDVDSYVKGTSTGLDTAKTNYQTFQSAPTVKR